MDFKKVALKAVLGAGAIIRRHHDKGLKTKSKGSMGRDMVTKADLESERFVVGTIKKQFPDHNFLTEEVASENNNSAYTWIVDPLDGTTNFSRSIPDFSVSIALAKGSKVILGLVYNPISKDLFFADSTGAYLNNKKINVSSRPKLSESIVSQSLDYSNDKRKDNLKNITSFFFKVKGFHMMNSTELELCYVACGRIDGFAVSGANPWDIAAGAFIIEKAGGKITEFDGKPWSYMRPRIVASNKLIHEELLKTLR